MGASRGNLGEGDVQVMVAEVAAVVPSAATPLTVTVAVSPVVQVASVVTVIVEPLRTAVTLAALVPVTATAVTEPLLVMVAVAVARRVG
jgi:hypothetical protein